MASRTWLGTAKDVVQVDTVTIANTWATSDTVTITIANLEFVVTIGSLVTTAQVATTLKQAFNGETLTDTTASCSPTIAQGGAQSIPQFAEITASVASSVVSLGGNTAGKPFTATATEVTAGSGTATHANSVACTGKSFFSDQDNWSGNTVPVDNDTIIFDSGSVDCKYGLTPAIQPASFIKLKTYTGNFGLYEINADNTSSTYPEYRTKSLTFDDNSVTCTYDLEMGEGTGSRLIRIDAGAGQSIVNTYGFGARAVAGQPTTMFTGTHTSNVYNVVQGDLGISFFGAETANVSQLRCGNGSTGGATAVCGPGCTFNSAAIDVNGGSLTLQTATASGDIDITAGGTVNILGTGAHADIDVRNGRCNYKTAGTLTTLAVRSNGIFDRAGDARAATITNVVNLYKGSTLNDPHGVLTYSAGLKLNGCTLDDVTVNVGSDRTYAIS